MTLLFALVWFVGFLTYVTRPARFARRICWCATVTLFASNVSAQTLTNDDIGKQRHTAPPATAATYAALKQHEYIAPLYSNRVPLIVRTSSADATLGPWSFPESRPDRRLDGTLLSDPPTVYGVPWFWPSFNVTRSGSERTRRNTAQEKRR